VRTFVIARPGLDGPWRCVTATPESFPIGKIQTRDDLVRLAAIVNVDPIGHDNW
jgi:hypothetical protein